MVNIRKLTWQQLARSLSRVQAEQHLSIRDIKEEYGHSVGKIHSYLLLAAALKVFPELDKIKHMTSALDFVRRKKFHRSLES